MKLDVTSPAATAKLEARWWGPNPAIGISRKWRGAEPIIHDLCHAAVMLRSTKPPRKELASCIEFLFDRFDSLVESDMSEIRALAVEELVLKGVGASPRVFAAVYRSGVPDNLRVMHRPEAKAALAAVRLEATVPRRAALVLRWLREAVTS